MSPKNSVLLGMSGGVDSSMAALLLQRKGYEVIGITFLFSGADDENQHFVDDAKQLASKLQIKHIVADLRKEFEEKIIRYFIDGYRKGRTPFPCAYCNPEMKFKYLEEYADRENCEFIATGHYVNLGFVDGQKYMFQGDDQDKDQTFFLWGLPRRIVDRLLFPLGEYRKNEIRRLALENGFDQLSTKKDSLGVCFIDGNDYRNFLKKRRIESKPGNFVYHNGEILGHHNGITNYTIGQRRGLGLNLNFPVFVAEIRLEANEIVLAKYEDLYRNSIQIKDYYFIDKEIVESGRELTVKVRYRLQETPCRLHILNETRAEVELLKSEAMISPGQTAVFYDGDRLVGGGFIESSE